MRSDWLARRTLDALVIEEPALLAYMRSPNPHAAPKSASTGMITA